MNWGLYCGRVDARQVTGVRAMRCMACGAEMILVNVRQDDTMAVPGFEHQTFRCSECQDLEQRLVFTKQDREDNSGLVPEQTVQAVVTASAAQDQHVAASALLTVSVESPQTVPVEPTQTAAVELTQIATTETTVPRTTQTVPVEPTIQDRPPLRSPTTVWAKALEKLHTFKQRAIETERHAQFNRVWDSFRSVRPSSASSESVSDTSLDESARSPSDPQ